MDGEATYCLGAEDEDAFGFVDLRRARAALEIVDVEEGAARGQAFEEARLDDAHAVLCGGPRVAARRADGADRHKMPQCRHAAGHLLSRVAAGPQEQMEGLRVVERLTLDPLARDHILEAAQLGTILDLDDDLQAR